MEILIDVLHLRTPKRVEHQLQRDVEYPGHENTMHPIGAELFSGFHNAIELTVDHEVVAHIREAEGLLSHPLDSRSASAAFSVDSADRSNEILAAGLSNTTTIESIHLLRETLQKQ